MFKNRYRLAVGLMTFFAFGLGVRAAFAQVVVLPTSGEGWGAMCRSAGPRNGRRDGGGGRRDQHG